MSDSATDDAAAADGPLDEVGATLRHIRDLVAESGSVWAQGDASVSEDAAEVGRWRRKLRPVRQAVLAVLETMAATLTASAAPGEHSSGRLDYDRLRERSDLVLEWVDSLLEEATGDAEERRRRQQQVVVRERDLWRERQPAAPGGQRRAVPSQWQNNLLPKPQTAWMVDNAPRPAGDDAFAERIRAAVQAPLPLPPPAANIAATPTGSGQHPPREQDTPFVLVETPAQLEQFFAHVRGDGRAPEQRPREIAVDLESHAHRSFQGFTCLLQASTRERDFVIDAIALRKELAGPESEFVRLLNDPSVLKVFHGADSDVLWLQRDFGPEARVCNCFDTGQAARVLNEPSLSLTHLLETRCHLRENDDGKVEADAGVAAPALDKRLFQTADWRIRPLPDSMLQYARRDTHYLLFIYDRLREELEARSAVDATDWLRVVRERSATVACQVYAVEPVSADGHVALAVRQRWRLSPEEMRVLAALFQWRDAVARAEDESPAYVMPNRIMYRLTRDMPRDEVSVVRVLNAMRVSSGGTPLELAGKRAADIAAAIAGALPPTEGESADGERTARVEHTDAAQLDGAAAAPTTEAGTASATANAAVPLTRIGSMFGRRRHLHANVDETAAASRKRVIESQGDASALDSKRARVTPGDTAI
ncbi:hypothetical protein CDCA_CDCA17G4351 [Cyanidium caldarium]|uniref:HRDC domain-containing protein n=1 Tax=Cyanidium caldarium TaxID=2771 RepID=A0AAV9J1S1_CYACA|nr:hypothetical protein CDCA_CDCA17G4351 [Cyanidium caldarium]